MVYGVIKFYHPEIDYSEKVPFATESEMHDSLAHSLETGFPAEQITCWVRNKVAAEKLFDIMDARGAVRSRCFELNAQNLNYVLA